WIISALVRPAPSRSATCAVLECNRSVSTHVGLIIVQPTPFGAPSSATQRVRPKRPAFDAQYAGLSIQPTVAAVEPMLIIRPQPRAIIPGKTARVRRKAPFKFVSIT